MTRRRGTESDIASGARRLAGTKSTSAQFATEKFTVKQLLLNVPDMLALFQDAVAAVPGPVNGSGVAAKKGTACGVTFNPTTEQRRPNLCHFGVCPGRSLPRP